jgi:hypothetical protein
MNGYQIYRKAWEVVGYTFNGSAYCPDCTNDHLYENGDAPAPVFVSDDYEGMTCDKCGEALK